MSFLTAPTQEEEELTHGCEQPHASIKLKLQKRKYTCILFVFIFQLHAMLLFTQEELGSNKAE